MKTNELMIGDWVCITDDDGRMTNFFAGKVEAVDILGNIYMKAPGDETAYPYSVDCAESIPLTSEILKKNGWKEYANSEDFHGPNCVFIKQKDGYYGACIDAKRTVSGPFKYVHELQHALHLCGIEIEIKL